MQKKTIIILSLVSAFLSFIYMLLNYYGIIRYIGLYLYSIEGYSKNYKKLDKIGQHRTIISMTATPKQMKKLTPVIKSLLDQTVRVDLISITIPYGNSYKLPIELKNSVSVFRCGKDRSLLNCISPVISRESESTTKIITVCATQIYGKEFIKTLLEESEKNPNSIIHVGKNSHDDIDLSKGVVFRTKFFKQNFLYDKSSDKNHWVNKYFKNTPKKVVEYTENYIYI